MPVSPFARGPRAASLSFTPSGRAVRSPRLAWVLALLVVVSSACSKQEGGQTPTSPTPPPSASEPVFYTAIGASDAVGVGGSVLCVPLTPCEGGTGYVPIVARRLASGRPVTLTNLGIPGAVLSPDTQTLARRFGRDIAFNIIDHQAPLVPRTTTLVSVFAGGNDANAVVAAIAAGAGGSDVNAFIEQQVRQFASDMARLIASVRDRVPSARIVVVNLPNLAALPYAAGGNATQRQHLRQLSVGYSTQGVNPLVSQGVIVTDLLCNAQAYNRANIASDGFHPNDNGYMLMADLLTTAINGASPVPPRASCPEMNF